MEAAKLAAGIVFEDKETLFKANYVAREGLQNKTTLSIVTASAEGLIAIHKRTDQQRHGAGTS